ncbi:MAG: RsmD family RNA methyltransferase [Candidatus Thorarchaeota archaeon]
MIVLDATAAKAILEALSKGLQRMEVSLDLGLSTIMIDLDDSWDVESLEKIATQENAVYFIQDGEYYQAAVSEEHYYRLFLSEVGKAPALLIDGVLMHRVKGIDPMQDARMKAALCVRKGSTMLEICTGLGYSTISCLERGAASITTIEKDPNVLKIAQVNPWSRKLFSDERVSIIEGDAVLKITEIGNSRYDGILHDPPRFTLESELYTTEFYENLYRVLKPRGVLYHYVGSPGKRYKKRDIQKGVISRLRDVGFRDVLRNEASLGIIARR